MKRKILITFSVLIALLIALFFIYSQFAQHQENNIIRIGYNVESLNHGPIMVAYEEGIFDKHNLRVELVPLKSGKEIQQALAIGRIDVGSAGATNFFIPISKGAPVKIIAPSTLSPTQVFVRPDGKIKTFNDLAGKTIASRLGGSSNLALRYALKKEGVGLDEIKFVDIEKDVRPIALMKKKIVDVAIAGEYEEKLYSDYGAIIFEEWKTKGYTNKLFPRTVVAVNTDFMNKNKKDIGLFIDAFIEAQQFIKNHPDEAAIIIAKHIEEGSEGAIKFTVGDIKDSWKEVRYVLWYEPSDFVEISKLAREIGDIESDLNLNQIFDLRFEERLKNAQDKIYK